MKIELFSFLFGIIIAVATIIVIEHIYGKFFGNKKLKELQRQVKHLTKVVAKKDELIKKSLAEMAEKEKHDKIE